MQKRNDDGRKHLQTPFHGLLYPSETVPRLANFPRFIPRPIRRPEIFGDAPADSDGPEKKRSRPREFEPGANFYSIRKALNHSLPRMLRRAPSRLFPRFLPTACPISSRSARIHFCGSAFLTTIHKARKCPIWATREVSSSDQGGGMKREKPNDTTGFPLQAQPTPDGRRKADGKN